MNKQELLNKGFQRFAERRYERAVNLFCKVIELDQQFEPAYSALSESLNRMGLIDEAIPVVKKWIELNKDDPLVHTALSHLYIRKVCAKKRKRKWPYPISWQIVPGNIPE